MKWLKITFNDIRQGENIDLYITILAALLVSGLNLFGLADSRLFGSLSLAVLALLVGSVLGLRHRMESLQSQFGKSPVRVFKNEVECLEYVADKVAHAKDRIDDISWDADQRAYHPQVDPANLKYRQALARAANERTCRDVVVFNRPGREKIVAERLDEKNADQWAGYSCGYYPEGTAIPRLQFMIVDGEEVIFMADALPQMIAITDPDVVDMFEAYYNHLWNGSKKLKMGRTVYKDEFRRAVER